MTHDVSLDSFGDIVAAIHEGPHGSPAWASLKAIRDAFAAKDIFLILKRPDDESIGIMIYDGSSGGVSPDSTYYTEGVYNIDPFTGLPPNTPLTLSEVVDADTLVASDFYRLSLEPFDIFYVLGADLHGDDGLRVNLRLTRRPDEPDFGPAEKRLLGLLLRHFELAIRTHVRLNEIDTERQVYAGAMAQLAVACLLIDERGRVVRTNPLADRLLASRSGIRLADERLQLGSAADQERFRHLLDEVQGRRHEATPLLTRALIAVSPQDGSRLSLVMRPLPRVERPEGTGGPVTIVFLSDPDQLVSPSIETLGALFELTPTEARLSLHLTNGHSVDAAAGLLEMSPYTARAHLRSIFSKTGVSRQGQLIRLILRSVATLG